MGKSGQNKKFPIGPLKLSYTNTHCPSLSTYEYFDAEKISSWQCNLHYFPRGWVAWTDMDTFCVYVGKCKKQQHKHHLSTHDSKMTDAVANFHPASFISDLVSI